MDDLKGVHIHITGVVQGVGFRPFVYGLAINLKLKGWVRNTSAGVDIEVAGTGAVLDEFIHTLNQDYPPLARIDSVKVNYILPNSFTAFEIKHSEPIPGAFIPISPDVSICDDCLQEMLDPADKRYLYPFINCTNCGPRFTIIEDIPYDRPMTTMAPFDMCNYCRLEYENPLNRRFHAQPIACPVCGPHVWLEYSNQPSKVRRQQNAVSETRNLLSHGKILAIKGLGGFHLACDATNAEAVTELRNRKLRVDKPFALMIPDLETVEQYCHVTTEERKLLISRQRPIVLLGRKSGNQLAPSVAPNQNTLGVMLPYTPLHYLLFLDQLITAIDGQKLPTDRNQLQVLVMTSGNISEEPIAYTNTEARERLSPLADALLLHNREIRTRCDDSVYRVVSPKSYENYKVNTPPSNYIYPLRRSRGYAPNPIKLPWDDSPQILATGPELKNTFCLTNGKYAFLSHHIGDMENYETLHSFEEGIKHFKRLFRIEPHTIACDLHPDYLATRYAKKQAQSANLPIYQIQHHHAHIAACLADNDLIGDHPVIGISFDGTGYGDDSAIWGGEFLLADYSGYQRVAHLQYAPLPGGDAAIRNPARIALAQLWQNGIEWDEELPPVKFLCGDDMTLLRSMLENDINCPPTSSMGRLFDAVAALSGICGQVNYEGQAAIEFEALANPDVNEAYSFEIQEPEENSQGTVPVPLSLMPNPLFHEVLSDLQNNTPLQTISAKFHNGLTNLIIEVCQIMQHKFDINEVALSGGVWQNQILLKKTISSLERSGFLVYIHKQVPANDGGLALGQAAITSWQLRH